MNEQPPALVRAEGLTERVADVVISCAALRPGVHATVDITVTVPNSIVTNRLAEPDSAAVDALLLVEDAPAMASPVIRGLLSAPNAVLFPNVPIAPSRSAASFRIVNLRVNAAYVSGSTVQASVAISGGVALRPSVLTVAAKAPGTVFEARSITGTAGRTLSFTPSDGRSVTHFLQFTEGFAAAFSKRDPAGDGQIPGGSGEFVSTAHGSRLLARFSNVPPGVDLYVTTTVAPHTGPAAAVLTAADGEGGGPFAPVDPASTVALGSSVVGVSRVALVDGSGLAVWEILDAHPASVESYTFGLVVAAAEPGSVDVAGALGPTGALGRADASSPVPRFSRFRENMRSCGTPSGEPGDCAPEPLRSGRFPADISRSASAKPRSITTQSISPSSGAGLSQTFTATFRSDDPAGIRLAYVWFTGGYPAGYATNTCLLRYNADDLQNFGPQLLSDNTGNWISSPPGALSNSQCTIGAVSMNNVSGVMTLTIPITFKPAFAGEKRIYISALDHQGGSDWQLMGTWTPTAPTATITVSSMSPDGGGVHAQALTFPMEDSLGTADIRTVQIWFTPSGAAPSDANTCKIDYDVATGSGRLRNDAGTDWISLQPGNHQCSVDAIQTYTISGSRLTVNPVMRFTIDYWGTKEVWLRVVGSAVDTGWQRVGTYVLPFPMSVQPYASYPNVTLTGMPNYISFATNDLYGAQDIQKTWVSIAGALAPDDKAGTCTFYYEPSSAKIYLLDDAGTSATSGSIGWSGADPVQLSNSQCALRLDGSVSASGGQLLVSVSVIFKTPYAGIHNFWQYAAGSKVSTGWQKTGSITVTTPAPPPVNTSVNPSSGTGASQQFQFRFADNQGGSNLTSVWMWFKSADNATDAGTCKVAYYPGLGVFNFVLDSGTLASVGHPGESLILSNSQCSIDLASASVTTVSGLTVNLPVRFSAWPGPREIRMRAVAETGETGYQQMGSWTIPPPGLHFVPVTPCRILDTRNAIGPLGGPFFAAGIPRSIPIPSSSCNIPSTAQAYSLNFTVVPRAGTLGYLTVWPTGQPQPIVSTLNSGGGAILANAAIVPAGVGGAISAFATNDTELIIDINGYFAPPAPGTLQFFPVSPCRVLDTRNAAGPFGGPSLSANSSRSFPVASSGCGLPVGASAYSVNVTVVPQAGLQYLTAWPTGQPQPIVSTLNATTGAITANAAIVPAGTNGAISFYATNATDLVVDVNGYFASPAVGGLNFTPVSPCRVVDTRNPAGPLGGPVLNGAAVRSFPLPQGPCALPATAAAYSLNYTVVPSVALGYLTTWPAGQPQPIVSTLNAQQGQILANAAIVRAGLNGAINVYVTDNSHVIIDANGYFAQ